MYESLSTSSTVLEPRDHDHAEEHCIVTLLQQLDAWLLDHICEFDPFKWTTPTEAETRRKAFSELALYSRVRSLGKNTESLSLKGIINHLANRVHSVDYMDLVKRDQINFVLYAAPLAFLQTIGRMPPALTEFCRRELDIGAIMGVEQPPNRIIEVWRFFDMLSVRENPVDLEKAITFSCLKNLPNFFRCSDVSAYALTHVIMYLAEFGHDLSALGIIPERAPLVLEALTLRFMAEGHMDLAIELALCHAIVTESISPIVDIVLLPPKGLTEPRRFSR